MKVNKKTTLSGEWAKIKEDIDNGNIITIKNEGEVISGDYGDRNVFKVETKNGEKLLSFNQTSVNYLIDVYGDETAQWIGKKIKVWVVKSNVGGKIRNIAYLTAPDWIETNEGFSSPTEGETGIPTIEDEGEQTPY